MLCIFVCIHEFLCALLYELWIWLDKIDSKSDTVEIPTEIESHWNLPGNVARLCYKPPKVAGNFLLWWEYLLASRTSGKRSGLYVHVVTLVRSDGWTRGPVSRYPTVADADCPHNKELIRRAIWWVVEKARVQPRWVGIHGRNCQSYWTYASWQ